MANLRSTLRLQSKKGVVLYPTGTRRVYVLLGVEGLDPYLRRIGSLGGHSEEVEDLDLVSKERAKARRYSAKQRGRLLTRRPALSSLSLTDDHPPRSVYCVCADWETTDTVLQAVGEWLRLPSTSRGRHGSELSAESWYEKQRGFELYQDRTNDLWKNKYLG